jgi:hypothetical protein
MISNLTASAVILVEPYQHPFRVVLGDVTHQPKLGWFPETCIIGWRRMQKAPLRTRSKTYTCQVNSKKTSGVWNHRAFDKTLE